MVLLDRGRQYTVTAGSQLFRHAIREDGCLCGKAEGRDKCTPCSTACRVEIVLSANERTVDAEATDRLESVHVLDEMLLCGDAKGDTSNPWFAPTTNSKFAEEETVEQHAEHRVPSKEPSQRYKRPDASRGILKPFKWWVRFNCGFRGCRSRSYAGELWDGGLVVLESQVSHSHALSRCTLH